MTIDQAENLAMDNGYLEVAKNKFMQYEVELPTARETVEFRNLRVGFLRNAMLLDPFFWQALGKGLGWVPSYEQELDHVTEDEKDCWCKPQEIFEPPDGWITVHQDHTWRGHWHSFVDHLAEGKTIESYFEPL